MPAQGLFKTTGDANSQFDSANTSSAVSCYDPDASLFATFLTGGACLMLTWDSLGTVRSGRYVFGVRSKQDTEPIQRLFNTVTTCAALTGFDVVFANSRSPQIHCLPLGDFVSESQDFFPALYFACMPGQVTGLCQIDTAGAMAASDDQGGIALFSTLDASRLAYRGQASAQAITALSSNSRMLISGSEGGDVKVWDTTGMDITPVAALSAHGHITSIGVVAALNAQGGPGQHARSRSRSRYHAVAATADGDLITWLLDLAVGSQNDAVLGVGMLSVADRAVRQVEMIRGSATPGVAVRCDCSDEGMSRICCIDVMAVAEPRIVADWPVCHACHMHCGPAGASSALQLWTVQAGAAAVSMSYHALEQLGLQPSCEGTGASREPVATRGGCRNSAFEQHLEMAASRGLPRQGQRAQTHGAEPVQRQDSAGGTVSLREATQPVQGRGAGGRGNGDEDARVDGHAEGHVNGSTGDDDEARLRLADLLGLAAGMDSLVSSTERPEVGCGEAGPFASSGLGDGALDLVDAGAADADASGEMSWDALRSVREQLEAMCASGDDADDTLGPLAADVDHGSDAIERGGHHCRSQEDAPSDRHTPEPQGGPRAAPVAAEHHSTARTGLGALSQEDTHGTGGRPLHDGLLPDMPDGSGAADPGDTAVSEGGCSNGSASLCHSSLSLAARDPGAPEDATLTAPGCLPGECTETAAHSPPAEPAVQLDDWLVHAEEVTAGVRCAARSSTDLRSADSEEPFALSKLCVAAGACQAPDDAARPQCSSSVGGLSWMVVEPRVLCLAEAGARVCGRSPGTVEHARRSQGAELLSADAERGTATRDVECSRMAVKPTSQGLLRRLLRKKPTVRQILGKDPAPPPPRRRLPARQLRMHAALEPHDGASQLPHTFPGAASALPPRARSPERVSVPQPRRASRIPPARVARRDPSAQEVVLLPVLPGRAASLGHVKDQGPGAMHTGIGSPQRKPLRDRGNDLAPASASPQAGDKGTPRADVQEDSMRTSSRWLGGLAQGAVASESDVTGRPAAALQQWRVERSCSGPASSACLSRSTAGHCATAVAQAASSPGGSPCGRGGSPHPLSQPRPGGMTQLLATRLALAAAAEPPTGPPVGWEETSEGIAARRTAATRAVNVPRGVTLYQRKSPAVARGAGKQPGGQANGRVDEAKPERRDGSAAGGRTGKLRQAAAARAVAGTVVPAPLMSDLWCAERRVVEVIDGGLPEVGARASVADITARMLGLQWPA